MRKLDVRTRHGRLALSRHGQGEAVLLLHGIPGSGQSWDPVARQLAERTQVLVPDLLGFAASDRPRDVATLHAAGQAQALSDLLDTLGVGDVTVVGHDFGGPVALMLTAEQPGRITRLGLLATNVFTDTPVPPPLSLLRLPVVGRLLGPALFSRAALAVMLHVGTGRPRARLDHQAHVGDPRQVNAIRTIFEGSLRHLGELYTPVQARLEGWSGPALVAWGDRDPFFSVAQGQRTAAAVGAPLTLLPGAGHFLPQERPERVAAEIATLLQTPTKASV